MKPLPILTAAMLITFLSTLTGYLMYRSTQPEANLFLQMSAAKAQTPRRPDFSLPDLQGQLRSNQEWDGKVVVVNFWATWCPPCLNEMPVFVELQQQYGGRGLQLIGVAIDDLAPVKRVSSLLKVNYPILVGEQQETIKVAMQFGNNSGVLPFTVLINRQGQVIGKYSGELEEAKIKHLIGSLLGSR